jgi:hypothetical protein
VDKIHKKYYLKIKQAGPEGKNPEESEIRYPLPPDWNADKDARLDRVSQNDNLK